MDTVPTQQNILSEINWFVKVFYHNGCLPFFGKTPYFVCLFSGFLTGCRRYQNFSVHLNLFRLVFCGKNLYTIGHMAIGERCFHEKVLKHTMSAFFRRRAAARSLRNEGTVPFW